MATIEELFEGRTETLSERSSAEIPYLVRQASDEAEVKTLAFTDTPLAFEGMPRTSIEITERINADSWKVMVRYETQDGGGSPNEVPEPVFSFDTGGGTQHVTQSIETKGRYGDQASDELDGAIGFDGEHVAGVDIAVPVYNFSETHYFANSTVDATFRGNLFRATGTTNSTAFRGFSPGEVLFLGASGSRRGTDPEDLWEITYKFAASPNRIDLTIGEIEGIAKKGWEYLWVQYAAEVDDLVNVLIKKPVAVYVEQVYPSSDFSALNLGA